MHTLLPLCGLAPAPEVRCWWRFCWAGWPACPPTRSPLLSACRAQARGGGPCGCETLWGVV